MEVSDLSSQSSRQSTMAVADTSTISVEELSSRKCITVADVRAVNSSDNIEGQTLDDAMTHFEQFCRRWGQKLANVETLDLVEEEQKHWSMKTSWNPGTTPLGGGFMQVIRLFEDGYFNDIRNLKICVDSCKVSPASMRRFSNLFRDGHLTNLRSLHFHFTRPRQTEIEFREGEEGAHENAIETFWESFPELVLSSPDLEELTVSDDGQAHCGTSSSRMRAAKALADQFVSGHLRRLQMLNLRGLGIGRDGIKLLAQAFHGSHTSELISFKLESNRIGKEGAEFLAEALQSHRLASLQTLDLCGNNLGDDGMVYVLATLLQSDQARELEMLDIAENGVGDDGIKYLAEALEEGKFPALRGLDVHGNRFGNEGLVALAKAFKSSGLCSLEKVDLFGGDLPFPLESMSAGLVKIAEALGNGSLCNLKMMNIVHNIFEINGLSEIVSDALENAYLRNPSLIADLLCNGQHVTGRMEDLRQCNEMRQEMLRILADEKDVMGEHGKIFLCGDALVGKTTLRMMLCDGSMAEGPERTRGIEVSSFQSEGVTLALWDLAGQHDFEVLHSAFLPDLNFANGQATFFAIVCDARNFGKAKTQLEYWMRFISSNSVKDMEVERRRRVFVVLNCFNGHRIPNEELPRWMRFLVRCMDTEKGFGRYLDVCKQPFIVNVTDGREVEAFKATLLPEAVRVLQRRKMPQVCRIIQEAGNKWARHPAYSKYPVLDWESYSKMVGAIDLVKEQKVKAAAEYLHETGHIILFKKVASGDSHNWASKESLVILNPEWFCKQVVGNLLLPPDMSNKAEDVFEFEEEEGAVKIATLTKEEFDVPEEKVNEVVMILSRLGICYPVQDRAGSMFVPALIDEVDVPGWSAEPWERGVSGWVMGYSVKVKNLRATLLPVSVLRNLQVSIALDECIGRRPDSDYVARKHCISFKFRGIHVLIEYSAHKQERMDILVKPLVESSSKREQISVAQEFESRIRMIVKDCVCGVELEKRVIQPWSIAEGWKEMQTRNIDMPVDFLIEEVRKKRKLEATNWGVEGKPVWEEDVLSVEDMSRCFPTTDIVIAAASSPHKKTFCARNGTSSIPEASCRVDLHFLEKTIMEVREGQDRISVGQDRIGAGQDRISAGQDRISAGQDRISAGQDRIGAGQDRIGVGQENISAGQDRISNEIGAGQDRLSVWQKKISAGQDKISAGQDRIYAGQDRMSTQIVNWERCLSLQIRNLDRCFMDDKEMDVPRFSYVTEKGRGPRRWYIQLNKALARPVVLRLLCEAPCDGQEFHEVTAQEGIDVNMIKDWAKKLLPAVLWTLKATRVAAKTLPGFMLLLNEDTELSKVVGKVADMTPGAADLSEYLSKQLEASVAAEHSHPTDSERTTSSWRRGREREIGGDAIKALRNVRKELEKSGEWSRKVGLTRVRLERSGGEKHVAWICKKCHEHYKRQTSGSVYDFPVAR